MSERRVDRTDDVLNVNVPQVFFSSLAHSKKEKLAEMLSYHIDSTTVFITCFLSWLTDKLIFFLMNRKHIWPNRYQYMVDHSYNVF